MIYESNMKLSFHLPHLSIQSLPTIDLPSFTLITGVNGAGKTHLLQAIHAGHVRTDVAPNPKQDIRFFDWTNLAPNNTSEFQTIAVYNERDQIIQWGQQARDEQRDALIQWASRYDLLGRVQSNTSTLLQLTRPDLDQWIDDPNKAEQAWQQLQKITDAALNKMQHNARNNQPMTAKLNQLRQRFGVRALTLGVKDFEDEPFGWGNVDVFQQSFAQLFLSYFELKKQNRLRRIDETEGRQPSTPSISDKEFVERYGEPPWDFVNRILADARLDFEIDYPVEYSATRFTPQLCKTTSGAELQFSQLSSGERILMSFAFCLYYLADTRQELQRPKLLLFDEIDAPLHPSMSRQLMDTIQGSLVKEQGVNVILATHSPSTVAVTPEEVVYVMRPDEPGLHKVGKRQAISVLTSEIPTLSINFSGRRQVFVESRFDAERYEKLYRYLSPLLSSERSLGFIAVGRKKKDGEDGGGCDQVKRIVDELVSSGNDSVFGLVDWDLKNESDDRIIVLAEDNRYAIENCLLDPLLVGALTVMTDRVWGQQIGLAPNKGYLDFSKLTQSECQEIIDGVERKVLGLSDGIAFGARQAVRYAGGISAQVSSSYLRMQGHELENKVKEKLPVLKKYHNEGELLMKLIDPVVFELRVRPIKIEVFSSSCDATG
jgi:predicted ATPase